MIIINRTYEIVTPESAENGEAAEQGYVAQGERVTFRALVDMLRNAQPSQWPCRVEDVTAWTWATHYGSPDPFDCSETSERYHFADKPNKLKYWRRAFVAAGIAREVQP